MTTLTPAESKRRADLLSQARVLVNKEYIARRAEQHQHWIANSESSWRTNGALLPYPAGILYPSEDEIVAKALELYNASTSTTNTNPVPLAEVPPLATAIVNPEINATVTAQLQAVSHAAPVVADEPTINQQKNKLFEIMPEVTTVPELVIDPAVDTDSDAILDSDIQLAITKNSSLRNLLAGWLQKNKDKET